jgi:chemotaxis protein methyltransferase CheR
MNQLTDLEFKALRDYIEKSCGIALGDEKAYLVENRLAGLVAETCCSSFGDLHRKAVNEPGLGLRDKIVDAMTTNETSWFRDSFPFEVLETDIFRQFAQETATGRRSQVRIWCAASSTGQEPYSIAIKLQEFNRKNPSLALSNVEITATDISPTVLFLAIAGRYDQISMSRGMTQEIKDRYFSANGKVWMLNDALRKMVVFKKLNLQESFISLGKFDLIFCRNVMIYFSDAFKRQLFTKFVESFNKGGYLFIGASESISNYSDKFTMISKDKRIYYQVNKEARP